MAIIPYLHEQSWFAAIRYTSGRGSGYILKEPYVENDTLGAYVYIDGCTDNLTTDKLIAFIKHCEEVVAQTGVLIASILAHQVSAVISALPGMSVIEDNFVDGRAFLVFGRMQAQKQLPEAIIYRFGNAIGDAYYASAVASAYGEQGFSLAIMAMESNRQVYANNPHVHEFIPLPEFTTSQMNRFIEFWSKRVRIFINLDWSIEGHLLKKSVENGYFWSDLQRRATCGKSYAKNVAMLAGLQPSLVAVRIWA